MSTPIYRKTLDEIKGDTEWTTAEQRLIEKARTGSVVFDTDRPDVATDKNTIRAPLIRHITLGGCEECSISETSVIIHGAFVSGTLDLEECRTKRDLRLSNCQFDTEPNLRDAQLGGLFLPGCEMPGLNAQRLTVDHGLYLRADFKASGTVDFASAKISGQLSCTGGSFDGKGQTALNASGITIGADIYLRDGFTAKGTVNLRGAKVAGQLDCSGASFDGNVQTALKADAITIGADVFLGGGFSAKGPVVLARANITGTLQCQKSSFDGGFYGDAM